MVQIHGKGRKRRLKDEGVGTVVEKRTSHSCFHSKRTTSSCCKRKWKSGELMLFLCLARPLSTFTKHFSWSLVVLWSQALLSALSSEMVLRRRANVLHTQCSVANALLLTFPVVGRALSLCSFNVCRPLPCSSSASEKARSFPQGL